MSSVASEIKQPPAVLEARGISRFYGRFAALKDIDLAFTGGEVHGLCGENGAGKSTFVKILGGLVAPSCGTIRAAGATLKPGHRTDPRTLSIVHQELSIIPDLSVLDNVLLGDDRLGEWLPRRRFRAQIRERLDMLGLEHIGLDQPARRLTLGERQLVEIARGVSRQARVLVLDEPTATLSDHEIRRVFAAVRWLRGLGTTILFISHRLPEIFALTDRVTVFRNGRKVLTSRTSELTGDALVRAMIGRSLRKRGRQEHAAPSGTAPVRVHCDGLCVPGRIQPTNLAIAGGEIVALVGQLGSGADALVEVLAGQCRDYRGHVRIDGAAVTLRTPGAAIRAGVAYVPEDRASKGVFLDASVEANLSASILRQLQRSGFLSRKLERAHGAALAARFTIDPERLSHETGTLSGGNQQKVAIAKAVAIAPRVLALNEPTRGVDVGARADIYQQLRRLAKAGMSVLFFSTDLEEVLELADRVVSIFRGKVVNDRPICALKMDHLLDDILQGPDRPRELAA